MSAGTRRPGELPPRSTATATMMRIMEIEGEPPDPKIVRDLGRRAAEMMKGNGKYPIIFEDMWPM